MVPFFRFLPLFIFSLISPINGIVQAQSVPFGGHKENHQVESDPFQGDWVGTWTGGREVVAMVVARGSGKYTVRVQDEFDHRAPPYDVVQAQSTDGELRIVDDVWSGTFQNGTFSGHGRFRNDDLRSISLRAITRHSPTEGRNPPAGATILFDGKNFDAWKSSSQKISAITWNLTNEGAMEIGIDPSGKGHGLESRSTYADLELHLEFRLPLQPRNTGQPRGNSGLFIGGYEVQILDSYGLEGYYNECGAFYKFKAPAVNMCYPPLTWQTYDVSYTAARFDAQGQVKTWPRFTVRHNGHIIHRDVELRHEPVIKEGIIVRPSREPRPLSLQFHGSRLQFRNIWILEPNP